MPTNIIKIARGECIQEDEEVKLVGDAVINDRGNKSRGQFVDHDTNMINFMPKLEERIEGKLLSGRTGGT